MRYIITLLFSFTLLFSYDFDHKIKKDEGGFWGAHYDIPRYSTVGLLAFAIYEGSESRIGNTTYKALEAGVISQVVAEGLKEATGRLRPRYTDNPNEWGEDGDSFPSGHVSGMTALVTPFVLEYQEEQPWIHILWALPIHQMGGRVKAQAHWQSDVLAGAAIGFLAGWLEHEQDTPFIVRVTDQGYFFGIKHAF
jgi:undecaprenyl-diphosphatase